MPVQPRSVEERLPMLEGQMQHLRDLPERVTNLESQFVQLRQEIRDGFSAIRSEMKERFVELSAQMRMLHEMRSLGSRRRVRDADRRSDDRQGAPTT